MKTFEIIPSLNCEPQRLGCVRYILQETQKFSERIHLDVRDGRFTYGKSWGDPKVWKALRPKARTDVHLMVERPEEHAESWLKAGAERLIVHVEALEEAKFRPLGYDPRKLVDYIAKTCKQFRAELVLAINPETSPERLMFYKNRAHTFLVMGVHPGLSYQRFLPFTIQKVELIKAKIPQVRVGVDGGLNPSIVSALKVAGADFAVVHSFIFESEDHALAYDELKAAVGV